MTTEKWKIVFCGNAKSLRAAETFGKLRDGIAVAERQLFESIIKPIG